MSKDKITLSDLQHYAIKQGKDYGQVFEEWMEWVIEIFDTEHITSFRFEEHFAEKSKENEVFTGLLLTWLFDNTHEQEQGRLIDWFGKQYEEQLKSKSKADALGQFYTPMGICEMMAKIDAHGLKHPEYATVDDCACGSGRLLIAMEQELRRTYGYSNKRYYTAADIDHMSVKMCALNLMIAGVRGQVLCRDTLRMETWYGYEINEVRYPMPVPMYSIRRITPEEAARITYMRSRQARPTEADPKEEEVTEHIAVKTDESGQVSLDFDEL